MGSEEVSASAFAAALKAAASATMPAFVSALICGFKAKGARPEEPLYGDELAFESFPRICDGSVLFNTVPPAVRWSNRMASRCSVSQGFLFHRLTGRK